MRWIWIYQLIRIYLQNNKKQLYKYNVFRSYTAGIVLNSTVVGQILKGSINLSGSYGKIISSEIFLVNFASSKWKLLLNKKEIKQISDLVKKEKYVIIPESLFLKNRKIKVELSLCKYNRNYEKERDKKYKRSRRDKYSEDY
ncbi:SsrA-binding protein [Mycoplasma parvum]|uniref:SsrA-binding protein n=1 Tax=Mycoplasma parvum str. Indiana TaxID=1403316 RepID=U5NF71_9MOLU|nr:SsrA-binding protein [Mycoplasma parvum]AGX88838.1 hypothetical protein PRV_00310 [Mycoplasma parvum str. Indiana]